MTRVVSFQNASHDCVVRNNIFIGNAGIAVWIEGSDRVALINNLIYDNANTSVVRIKDAASWVARNNTVSNSTGWVFSVSGSPNGTLLDNIVASSGTAVRIQDATFGAQRAR